MGTGDDTCERRVICHLDTACRGIAAALKHFDGLADRKLLDVGPIVVVGFGVKRRRDEDTNKSRVMRNLAVLLWAC